jgi:hypothetical protein
MQERQGHAWRENRREPQRRGRTGCGSWRKAGLLGGGGDRIGLEEGVEIGGWGGANKGKHIIVKDDVTRDDNAVGGEVQKSIPLVVWGVAKEDAAGGARRKLMRGGSGSVRVAGTAEHAEVVVGGGCAVQDEVGSGVSHRLRGKTIEKVCGGVQGLCPVAGRERRLEEKAADHIGGGADHAFGTTVLCRGVRARETQLGAMSEKERARGVVVELAAVVTLQGTNRAVKLGGDPGEEVCEGGERVGLQPKRESPKKVGKVIQNHQIVFITRNTEYRGGLEITVNQVKSLLSLRRGRREGETSMPA